jgi:glutamate 5-kinase
MNRQDLIKNSKRVVIKVGSALLIDEDKGKLKNKWLASLALDINDLIKLGKEVILVSSGSIALGKKQLNLNKNLSLDEKQAAAATGQITLAHGWKETLGGYGLNVAQILLAPDDTETRRKHLNARATLIKLIELNVIPVINENDTEAQKNSKLILNGMARDFHQRNYMRQHISSFINGKLFTFCRYNFWVIIFNR